MSKNIKEDNKKDSSQLYQFNRRNRKELIPSGNTNRKIIQINTTFQSQKTNFNLLTELNYNQRNSPMNIQKEKIITTVISRRNSQGLGEKNLSQSIINSNKVEVVTNSRRKYSNRVNETQNENNNINNMINIQKNYSFYNKEVKNENKNNIDKTSNNNSISKNDNQSIVIINRRQKNINMEKENDNKIELKRPQSEDKSQNGNTQFESKYLISSNIINRNGTSQLAQSQSQYIQKYNSKTAKINRDSKTPNYKINSIPVPPRQDNINNNKSIDRSYKYSNKTISNIKNQEPLNGHRSSHNIYISNSSNSNIKDDKNNNKLITSQNYSYPQRNYNSIKLLKSYNEDTSNISYMQNRKNENENKSSYSVPKRDNDINNLKSNPSLLHRQYCSFAVVKKSYPTTSLYVHFELKA